MDLFARLMSERAPMRKLIRFVLRTINFGTYEFRLKIGALHRPQYAYIVYQSALLASRLNVPRISVLEFGVAGGDGLLWMERHAQQVERLIPSVKIDVYGFDTGVGLPSPQDHRDLPYHWKSGFFAMDIDALRQKLTRARLVIGDVAETTKTFAKDFTPAPIGAIVYDLDFYSSTSNAMALLREDLSILMPRIFCYFDDTVGSDCALYNDYTGQRLSIHEFNENATAVKVSPAYHLRIMDGGQAWKHQIWIAHAFEHPSYNTYVSDEPQQLPL